MVTAVAKPEFIERPETIAKVLALLDATAAFRNAATDIFHDGHWVDWQVALEPWCDANDCVLEVEWHESTDVAPRGHTTYRVRRNGGFQERLATVFVWGPR